MPDVPSIPKKLRHQHPEHLLWQQLQALPLLLHLLHVQAYHQSSAWERREQRMVG